MTDQTQSSTVLSEHRYNPCVPPGTNTLTLYGVPFLRHPIFGNTYMRPAYSMNSELWFFWEDVTKALYQLKLYVEDEPSNAMREVGFVCWATNINCYVINLAGIRRLIKTVVPDHIDSLFDVVAAFNRFESGCEHADLLGEDSRVAEYLSTVVSLNTKESSHE